LIEARVSVSPAYNKEQATATLSAPSTSFPARLWSKPSQPTRVELVYLPYYLASVFFIGDALIREPGCDGAACDFVQSSSAARETAMQEYRWLMIEHGLRNKLTVSVEEISEPERVHYPFWVAYFKKRGSYDFKALDAVSGEIQGIKMRKVFLAAFRQMSTS
jgi:hypothetical protein